jgi:hypothetical protein
MTIKHDWRRYLPNIGLSIEIPFISLQVMAFYERWDMLTVEWFRLDWRVYRWKGHFNLYWKPTR